MPPATDGSEDLLGAQLLTAVRDMHWFSDAGPTGVKIVQYRVKSQKRGR